MARLARRLGLVAVLSLATACGGGGGGGGGGLGLVSAMCQRVIGCGYLQPSQLDLCIQAYRPIELYVANPARTRACLDGLDCADLVDPDVVIATCVAYDTAQFSCSSKTALNVCNIYDECRDVDCIEACQTYYSVDGVCGYNPNPGYQYDMCLCGG